MTTSIAEILEMVSNAKTKKEKIALLQKYKSKQLINVLICIYDTAKMVPNIPNEAPPYKPSDDMGDFGGFYREARKLKYFFEGWGGDNLKQDKRENLFIQILESVHPHDAKVFINCITQEPIKGITVNTINKAYGDII